MFKNHHAFLRLPFLNTISMDHSLCISVPHSFHDISNKFTTK